MQPIILISGEYNVFKEGWDGVGSYMCSGLYVSDTFKSPIYIGGTETIQQRIENEHIARLNNNKHDNRIFQFSWNKHNLKDGFVWWLLETCESGQSLIIEQKYLDLYRPFVDEFGGFNISHYATSPMKGRKHTKETKKKQSESHLGEKCYWFGKNHSKESIEKIREGRKLQDMTFCKKKVKQLDLEGNLIKIWDSATEAAIGLTGKESSHGDITSVCRKRIRTNGSLCMSAFGYKWEYYNE